MVYQLPSNLNRKQLIQSKIEKGTILQHPPRLD